MLKFTKMHGAGNDYVYVDCTKGNSIANPNEAAIKISDRHFGVGSDGLVLICKSDVADFKMRMFNADGSEAQMCGNAARCIGKYVYDKALTAKTDITLETTAGIKYLRLLLQDGKIAKVQVDMGIPELLPAKIPVKSNTDSVIDMPHTFGDREFRITCVSMGNPHTVVFVDNVDDFDVHYWGKIIETDALFPEKCNVEFVQVVSRNELKMRVWERGSGETLACGTGACASLTAAVCCELADRKAILRLLGGALDIEWNANNHILMTGEAITVFEGEYFEE
jgi:diaminopimelate epimerase